jgi:hypothetical protein
MQYPTIGQPQYGFAPTMPGMASGGLASLPVRRFQSGGSTGPYRYSYDPVTQRYTLLTPEQQANQMMAAQKYDYAGGGGDGGVGSPGSTGSTSSGTVGSSGTMGGIAQGVNAAVSNVQSALGPFSMAVPGLGIAGALSNMGVNQAMDVNEQADAALAAANQQANQATVSMGAFGPQVTTAVDISPVANPAAQQITSINPNVTEVNPVTVNPVDISPIAALTAMNQQQAEEETQVSPVDVAMDVAEAVGVDAVDAVDASAAAASTAASTAASGSAMGDSGAGIGDVGGGGGGSTATGGSDTSSTGSGATDTGAGTGNWRTGGRVMNYEQGGLAAARQAQSKGRGQDTMLVHMTPGEVKGLQALAMSQGGSLTINPQTGLPEAGFLSAILPMVAGFALGPAGFGLFSSALTTGLGVGALTGIATGSLKKGLMAGLGAYGGAGLGQGLVNAATPLEGAIPTGAEAGLTSASEMAASNLSPEALNANMLTPEAITQSGINSPYYKMAQSNIDPGLLEGMGGTPGMTAQQVATAPVINPTPSIPTSPTTGFARAGEGFTNMFDTGQVGTDARSAFMKATPTGTLPAAGTTLASALTPEPEPLKTSVSNIRPYKLDITNPSGTPQYTPQDTREREQVRYTYTPQPIYQAAQGGLAALNGHTFDDEYGRDEYEEGGSVKKRKSRSLKGDPYYKFAQDRRDSSMEASIAQNFAKGGLGAALPPRFLSGGGDGMSDSIKANIDGKQEARLADGEFVVPADVVSHLGNGSSKAGAKKLYAMMDKIRKARTGRERQAPEVNARRYMPA